MEARLDNATLDLKGDLLLTFKVKAEKGVIDDFKDKDLELTIKEWKPKRSLDANAYFWVLLDKITAKMNQGQCAVKKEDLYRQYIQQVGGNSYIMPVLNKDKEQVIKLWQSHGLGWVCDDLNRSKIPNCSNIVFYAGSSTYDTAQMSTLIDLVVQDAKALGIETMTPEKLALLKGEWN